MKSEDIAKPNSFLNKSKFLFEPLHSVFSNDDIVLKEDEVEHNSLEITTNPVTIQKTVIVWDRYSSWQNLVRRIAYIKLMIRNRDKAKQTKRKLPINVKSRNTI